MSALRERLLVLADNHPNIVRPLSRDEIALAAARMVLEEAQRECVIPLGNDYIYRGTGRECYDAISALRATLDVD